MDEELSKDLMMDHVKDLDSSPLLDRLGWETEVDDLNLVVAMPSPKDGEVYELLVNFDDFPEQPPSYLFDGDWPNSPDIKQNKGVCIRGTREFYNEFGHSEHRSEWDQEKYNLTVTLQKIHHLMRK